MDGPSTPSSPASAGINSLNSLHANSGEISAAKYQKLATEYAKLRAQVTVLKKAVVDEQSKTLQLKEEIQTKNVTIRKQDQESDSLSFRNKQLERRIQVLQDELNDRARAAKSKHNKKSGNAIHDPGTGAHSSQEEIDYELFYTKIEENCQLHKKISEMEESHKLELSQLRFSLEEKYHYLENKCSDQESEKLALNYTLQNTLDEIEAYKEQVVQLQEKLRNHSEIAKEKLEADKRSKSREECSNFSRSSSIFKDPSTESSSIITSEPKALDVTEGISFEYESAEVSSEIIQKLTTAEQNSEHWMSEFKLLKMKFNKLFEKWEEAKEVIQRLGGETSIPQDKDGNCTPSSDECIETFTTMLGKIEIMGRDDIKDVEGKAWPIGKDGKPIRSLLSFEKEVKQHLIFRINELVAAVQMANSKAITYHSECTSMKNLVEIIVRQKIELEEELESFKSKLNESQEELNLTKSNYESQINALTEHIANITDKMSSQQEMIDQLEYEVKQNKGHRK